MGKYSNYSADDWSILVKKGMTKEQIQNFVYEIYLDGWTDGQCHKTNLTPNEFKERAMKDLKDSWSAMIVDDTLT